MKKYRQLPSPEIALRAPGVKSENVPNLPPFNPAMKNGSYEAKVWECMRRNEKFSAMFNRIADSTLSDNERLERLDTAVKQTDKADNVYAMTVLVHTLGQHVGRKDKPADPFWPSQVNLQKNWSELPDGFCRWFKLLGHGELNSRPHLLDAPEDASALWHSHHILAVPRFSGRQSREEFLAAMLAEIPQTKSDPRIFKARGKVLGAAQDWAVYLSFERWWKTKKFNLDECHNLAAHENFKPKTIFGSIEEAMNALRPTQLNIKPAVHNHRSTAAKHVGNIDSSIRSVFMPEFRPYEVE